MSSATKTIFSISLATMLALFLVFIAWNQHNNLFKQPEVTDPRTELTFIPLYEHDPVIGNPQAPITIVAFEDFLCDGCRAQNIMLEELSRTYPNDVKVIWKDLSIVTIPQSSELIHAYGYCLNEQRLFTPFKDTFFANYVTADQSTLDDIAEELGANARKLSSCLSEGSAYAHLDKNKTLARALNIQSVPTFFINDQQIVTPQSYREWVTTLGLE